MKRIEKEKCKVAVNHNLVQLLVNQLIREFVCSNDYIHM